MASPRKTNRDSEKFEWETKGPRQLEMRRAISEKSVVFATGPAGTGKTWVATCCALDALDKKIKGGGVDKIMVTRPLVTVGEKMGFIPGDIADKINPFMRPVYDIIKSSNYPRMQTILDESTENPQLEGVAHAYMRGTTITDTFFIVDEAQNLTRQEFEMILTRLGPNSKMVITGDTSQTDLKFGQSGLPHAVHMFRDNIHCAVVEFTVDDVQRSDFVGDVIRAYANDRALESALREMRDKK